VTGVIAAIGTGSLAGDGVAGVDGIDTGSLQLDSAATEPRSHGRSFVLI
jgi:hypothetical protein